MDTFFSAMRFAAILVLVFSLCGVCVGGTASHHPQDQDEVAIRTLLAQGGDKAKVRLHTKTGKVRFFSAGGKGIVSPTMKARQATLSSPEAAARAFLTDYGPAFGIKDAHTELKNVRERALSQGGHAMRFQQLYKGLPVLGGEIIVHENERCEIKSALGEISPELALDTQATVQAEKAEEVARELCARLYGESEDLLVASAPELAVYDPFLLGAPGIQKPMLVWQLEVTGRGTTPIREYVLVEAHSGKVVLHFSKIYHAKNRMVYDTSHTATLRILVRSEGQPPSSIFDANAAYDGTGSTYDFFWNHFGRDSIDGAGMTLISSVRFCPSSSQCPYENAFWDGTEMVFGDGMAADDVCAHELMHGITEAESHLFYYMQSGAINEAMSDIFGEFVDLTNGLGTDTADARWLIGEDLPTSVGVIRNMADPPQYYQPDTTTHSLYWCGSSDNGGVHYNSGIANKCAYLMTDGGTFNGYTVAPLGIAKTARIWYEVNCHYLTSASDYEDLYDALIEAALSLVGTTVYGGETISLADVQQVKNAADAVGMAVPPTGCPAFEALLCSDEGKANFDLWYDDLENPSSGKWTKGYAVRGNRWYYPQNTHPYSGFDATYATSGVTNFFGDNDNVATDSWIAMTQSVALPNDGSPIFMHFRHAYDFEGPNYDGGVVEYSIDGGASWLDAGSLIEFNGYTNTLHSGFGNPLGGRQAFCGKSSGYISTRLNLTSLAGQSVRFRFRIGTDSSVYGVGWFIDDIRIYTCGYRVETKSTDPLESSAGWNEFVRVPATGGLIETSFDSVGQALRIRVSSDASRYRIAGWLTNQTEWLPYLYVGPDNYVRGKFYVYATGQANPTQLNTIPNFRLRLANRFAVTSMLEVLPHSSATSGDEPISLELRPSTNPAQPSLYRVDFDPVDVPQLVNNPVTEGITRGFEIYALDPQDNGYVCLTESSIGVYPRAAVSVVGSALMWLATYAPTASSAGDLDPVKSGTTLDRYSLVMTGAPGDFPTKDSSIYPQVSAGSWGVTLDSTTFDNQGGMRVGVVQLDFSPDVAAGQRVRIEPNKQYMIRYHVTSTQQSNLNPQLRLRARSVRFAWTQKYEIGGSWAVNTAQHTALTAQALPGIGCMNPDKVGGEAGGWYTLIMHSPLNIDIRPDVAGPIEARMPNLMAQPGPGVPGNSLRDLKVAFDMIDTMSPSINAYLEAGNFTLDRIEVFSFNQIPD